MKKLLLICLVFLANTQLVLAQCAMCRSSVESTFSDGRYVNGSGLNTGILYLLSLPYLVVLVVGWLWYRSSKLERQKRLAISRRIKAAL
ncbi:MAG: hypothetical protein LH606_22075 [Cytophagaceae bacterium]|nr:hypothetical protein [Cytophagaceae bacterium]